MYQVLIFFLAGLLKRGSTNMFFDSGHAVYKVVIRQGKPGLPVGYIPGAHIPVATLVEHGGFLREACKTTPSLHFLAVHQQGENLLETQEEAEKIIWLFPHKLRLPYSSQKETWNIKNAFLKKKEIP